MKICLYPAHKYVLDAGISKVSIPFVAVKDHATSFKGQGHSTHIKYVNIMKRCFFHICVRIYVSQLHLYFMVACFFRFIFYKSASMNIVLL